MTCIQEVKRVENAFKSGARIEFRRRGEQTWQYTPWPAFVWGLCEYRVITEKQVAVSQQKNFDSDTDDIPWEAINPRFTHAAREPNGMIFIYDGKPEIVGSGFSKARHHVRIDHIFVVKVGQLPWNKSLQERPS